MIIIIFLNNKTERFTVKSYDNSILSEDIYMSKNFKNENKFNKYLETRNRKYENMFKGSNMNK